MSLLWLFEDDDVATVYPTPLLTPLEFFKRREYDNLGAPNLGYRFVSCEESQYESGESESGESESGASESGESESGGSESGGSGEIDGSEQSESSVSSLENWFEMVASNDCLRKMHTSNIDNLEEHLDRMSISPPDLVSMVDGLSLDEPTCKVCGCKFALRKTLKLHMKSHGSASNIP